MEQAGCICALPEYCFTNYLEPGYKEEDILVELCETVTECKDDTGELHFKTMPKLRVASVFHKGSYNTLATSYESVLKYVEENGYEIVGAIRESYIDGVWNKEDESGFEEFDSTFEQMEKGYSYTQELFYIYSRSNVLR